MLRLEKSRERQREGIFSMIVNKLRADFIDSVKLGLYEEGYERLVARHADSYCRASALGWRDHRPCNRSVHRESLVRSFTHLSEETAINFSCMTLKPRG